MLESKSKFSLCFEKLKFTPLIYIDLLEIGKILYDLLGIFEPNVFENLEHIEIFT
jgi:hypothetical protein